MILLVAVASVTPFEAAAQEHWTPTWAASPQAARFVFPRSAGKAAPAARNPRPAQKSQTPLFQPPPSFKNQTVRMTVHTSIGGRRARIQLSNAFGATALRIGAAHLALGVEGSSIQPGFDRALSFSGRPAASIPPGAELLSDPVDMEIPQLGDVVVSLYIATEATSPTTHLTGLHTTYISKTGDFTSAPNIPDASTRQSWYFLTALDVLAPVNTGLIVAFGDSITDGATSTPNSNRSWPSQLAARLLANKATAAWAIVNEGISGNRLLNDGAGVSALARFDRDVLSQPGIASLIVLEGINDIGLSKGAIPVEDLIAAHQQIIERAHVHGIKVIGATLTPFGGATYYTEEGEAARQALNRWIRTSHAYDAVIDFDAVTQDPQNPPQIRADFNIRDHLHPNDAGYKAMAEAIDLSIFSK